LHAVLAKQSYVSLWELFVWQWFLGKKYKSWLIFSTTHIFLKGLMLNTAVEILNTQQHYQPRQESSKWIM